MADEIVEVDYKNGVEFACQTAGSTTIMSDGRVLRFLGPAHGVGSYLATAPDEIRHLESAALSSRGTIWKVNDAIDRVKKPEPREVIQATADAMATAVHAQDSQKAVESFDKLVAGQEISSGAAADSTVAAAPNAVNSASALAAARIAAANKS